MADEKMTIQADLSQLKKEFQDASRNIRLANSEFKAATAGMDDWKKSSDGLNSKLTQLNKVYDAQKQKLGILEKQYDEVVKAEGENSKAAQELKIKINNQQSAVNSCEKEMRDYSQQLDKLADAENEASRESNKLDNALEKVGREAKQTESKTRSSTNGFTVLKGVVANLASSAISLAVDKMKELGSAIVDTAHKVDDLNTLSSQTGIDVMNLQKWNYASQFIDTDVNSIAGSIKKLTKNMTSSSKEVNKVFDDLQISTKDTNGNLRNSQEVFFELIDALGKIENETERDNKAMALFGKSAGNLNPLIEAGSQAFKEQAEEAQSLGIIMDKDQIEKYQELDDAINKVKAIGTGWLQDIGSAILKEVPIETLTKKFEEIPEKIQPIINKGKELINALKPIAEELWKKLKPILQETMADIKAVADWIIEHSEEIKTVITAVIDWCVGYFTTYRDIVKAIFQWIYDFIVQCWENIKIAYEEAPTFFQDLWNLVSDWIQGIWNDILTFFGSIWNSIKNVFYAVPEFFSNIFTSAVDKIKNVFSSIGDWFGSLWDTIKGKVTDLATGISDTIGDTIKSGLNGVLEFIESVLNKLPSIINGAIELINDIPGVDIGWRMEEFNLPRLAKGGIVNKSTIANIGEAGREAIVPLENNLGWLDKIANNIVDRMNRVAINNNSSKVVNNFYQTNNSPKALSRFEIYRQSKNLLKLR